MDDDTSKQDAPEEKPEHEEAAPKEAVEAQAEVLLASQKNAHETENKKSRMKLFILALLTIVIGAVVFFLLLSGDSDTEDAADADSSETSETSQEAPAETEPTDFDQIVYLHADAENQNRKLFQRSVMGGEREDLDFDAGRNSFILSSRDGSSYAIGTQDGEVYYAEGADAPTLLYTATNDLNSLHLDMSSNTILVAESDSGNFTSVDLTVTVVPIDGATPRVFFTETNTNLSQVLYVEAWDGDSQTLYGRRSCTQCDGYDPNLVTIDASGNESAFYSPEADFNTSGGYEFNSDMTQALFIASTVYTQAEQNNLGISGGLGGPNAAPFTLKLLDLSSGTASEVATFGEATDVNSNGFFDVPVTAWADRNGEEVPVYAYGTKLYVQSGNGSFDNFFETTSNPIASVYVIDDDEVLVGSRLDDGQRISYFNIETQEGAIVMETLFTSNILSVTKK